MRGSVHYCCPPSYLAPVYAAILCYSSLVVQISGAKNCFLKERRLVYLWWLLSHVLWNFQHYCKSAYFNSYVIYTFWTIRVYMLEGNRLTHPCILFLFLLLFLWRGEPSHPTYCLCFFEGRSLSRPYRSVIALLFLYWSWVGELSHLSLFSCYCSWRENCLNLMTLSCFCYCSSGGEKDCLDPILFPVIVPEGRYYLNLVLFSVVVLWREILSQPVPFSCVPVRPRAPSWPCWERRVLASVHLSTKAMCPESFGGIWSTVSLL